MRLIPLIMGAFLTLLPNISSADMFLYGNCKKIPDRYSEFYRCLSDNGQIVYTNILPSKEDEAMWRRAYRKWDEKRKKRLADAIEEEVNRIPEHPACGPDGEPTPACETSKEEPKVVMNECYDAWVKAQRDIRQLSELLLLKWMGTKNQNIDEEIDNMALEVGKYVGGPCNI